MNDKELWNHLKKTQKWAIPVFGLLGTYVYLITVYKREQFLYYVVLPCGGILLTILAYTIVKKRTRKS